MKTVCKKDQCCGCYACVAICKQNAIFIRDDIDAFNAVIDESKCISCGRCLRLCPNNSPLRLRKSISWYQGWTKRSEDRARSSSGGFATAIAKGFIKNDGIVCSCAFSEGLFGFLFADVEDDVAKFSGSKYIKSNPQGCYEIVKCHLEKGKKVLFIGLPCQAAAIQNYIGSKYKENLYVVDLICHGTPSVSLLNHYLAGKKYKLEQMQDISFRENNCFGLSSNNQRITPERLNDSYISAFLEGLSYTENCYYCQYATNVRVSDLTLGDSWGSELAAEEIEKGISLAFCQTTKGEMLLANAELELFPVNYEHAVQSNAQLQSPSVMPRGRSVFFSIIKLRRSFECAYGILHPLYYIKQSIKKIILFFRG